MIRFKALAGVVMTILLVMVGWYGLHLYQEQQTASIRMTSLGVKQLPAFSLPDLEGRTRHSSEWKGKVLVINFWATWCPPCRKEMPLFIEMQEQYAEDGVQFVGIAIDDPDMVQDFYDVYGINFPTLIGGAEAIKLANTLGNRFDSLPFTAIFDRQGNTRYVQAGEVTKSTLLRQLAPLIQ